MIKKVELEEILGSFREDFDCILASSQGNFFKKIMKIRRSFFIRWLLSVDEEKHSEQSVIDIENIQTGETRRVSTMEEAGEWMELAGKMQDETQLVKAD